MLTTEMKFAFDGIIFSSQVFVDFVSDSLNKCEFTITFLSKYLKSKYRDCYFFVLENNQFKKIYSRNEKEDELIKALQDGISEVYQALKEKSFVSKLAQN
jgi:hypothetical protein